MDLSVRIDAELSLSDTQARCEVEQAAGFQLSSITMDQVVESGKTLVFNRADFDLKLTNRLNKLLFVEVGGNNPTQLRQQNEGQGWTFIKAAKIYVKSVPTNILMFGKKTT